MTLFVFVSPPRVERLVEPARTAAAPGPANQHRCSSPAGWRFRNLGAGVDVIERRGVAERALDAETEQLADPAHVAAGGSYFVEDAVLPQGLGAARLPCGRRGASGTGDPIKRR
ncbi:MAG: hypothetical protein ACRDZW_03275 [Acidimicrobiales bacterium]